MAIRDSPGDNLKISFDDSRPKYFTVISEWSWKPSGNLRINLYRHL